MKTTLKMLIFLLQLTTVFTFFSCSEYDEYDEYETPFWETRSFYDNSMDIFLSEGLIAYYPFNGNTYDYSGNRNDLKGFVSSGLTEDRLGNEKQAYSSFSYSELESHFPDLSTPFTFTGWIYSESEYGDNVIFETGLTEFGMYKHDGAYSEYNDKSISIHRDGTTLINSPEASIELGTWTFIACVIDTDTTTLIINNKTYKAKYDKTILSTDASLHIGADWLGNDSFLGKMDELRFYNRALSSDEIVSLKTEENYTIPANNTDVDEDTLTNKPVEDTLFSNDLIAYYPFKGNSDDYSGNGYNCSGTDVKLTTDRFGVKSNAYDFDGEKSYLIPDDFPVLSKPFTFAGWMYAESWGPQENTGYGKIFQKGDFSVFLHNDGYSVYQKNSLVVYNDGDEILNTAENSIELDKWTFISCIIEDNKVELYINNEKYEEKIYSSEDIENSISSPVYIGNNSDLDRGFEGSLDDFRFYSRALTTGELTTLFNEGDFEADKIEDSQEIEDTENTEEHIYPDSCRIGKSFLNFAITDTAIYYKDNLDSLASFLTCGEYRIADWEDLVSFHNLGGDLEALMDALGFSNPDLGSNAFVTYNGNQFYSSSRAYFISRHDHNCPGGYLAHEDIDNHLISLGSYSATQVILLVKK